MKRLIPAALLLFTLTASASDDREEAPRDTFLGDHAITLDPNSQEQDPAYDEDRMNDPVFDELMDEEGDDADQDDQ